MASQRAIAACVVDDIYEDGITNVELERRHGIPASEIADLRRTESWNLPKRLVLGEIARIEVAKREGVQLYPATAEDTDKTQKQKADDQ